MRLRARIGWAILSLLLVTIVAGAFVLSYSEDCGLPPAATVDSESMRAVLARCYGSPDVLELATVQRPVPADNEILVRISAAGVNPLDWHYMRGSPYLMRLGSGLGAPDDPRTGVDFAGTVVAVGEAVSKFEPGDEVFGGRSGAFAEYLVIDEDAAVVVKPENLSYQQAAAVPIAAITALQALRDKGQVQAGMRVLINGASGGVGTFAVQIAKAMGAEVSAVCSTRNVELVRSIGADRVFDYTRENYTDSGEHFDVIIDNVGNQSLLANRKVLTPDGTYVMVGGPPGNWIGPLLGPLKMLFLAPFVKQELALLLAEMRADDLEYLADLMRHGEVTPVLDRSYVLAETAEAIRYSEEGHARGKIVIEIR